MVKLINQHCIKNIIIKKKKRVSITIHKLGGCEKKKLISNLDFTRLCFQYR